MTVAVSSISPPRIRLQVPPPWWIEPISRVRRGTAHADSGPAVGALSRIFRRGSSRGAIRIRLASQGWSSLMAAELAGVLFRLVGPEDARQPPRGLDRDAATAGNQRFCIDAVAIRLGPRTRPYPPEGQSPEAYCHGDHSVNASGVKKLVGTAQRMAPAAWLFTSLVVVGDDDLLRPVLAQVHRCLGQNFDEGTVGSLSREVPAVAAVVRACLKGSQDPHPGWRGRPGGRPRCGGLAPRRRLRLDRFDQPGQDRPTRGYQRTRRALLCMGSA
jgi:hypothetical protein